MKKRNRQELSGDEIRWLIRSYTDGEIPDYQMSAWLMSVFFNGMTFRETTDLTLAMRDSGVVVDLSSIPGIKVDKHSTGGVGDKISLILAPLAASLGVVVPMISGRGLGHTGGTLDKLESITGFDIFFPMEKFIDVLRSIGVCMIGQTAEIAPADKKLYALRDVTATVESIPLISASIMSKKLAEGIDALVLDVKVGNGAFMRHFDDAVNLAQHLVSIGESAGKSVVALLTNMDEPLGEGIGNWLEVRESLDVLRGGGPQDIIQLTLAQTAYMLMFANPDMTYDEAYARCKDNLNNGKAFDKFREIVRVHGGNLSYIDRPETYPEAECKTSVYAQTDGFVTTTDTLQIGLASVAIGAGRSKKEDTIDPTAGIVIKKKVGDAVQANDLIAEIYHSPRVDGKAVAHRIQSAYRIEYNAPDKKPLIYGILDKNGLKEIENNRNLE